MYSLAQLKKGISSPDLAVIELIRLYKTRLSQRDYNPNGIDIFDKDWDNLIILDACRFDYFRDTADLPGRLESQISRAGTTKEFISANFSGKQIYDTVYVSANGWYSYIHEDIDADIFKFISLNQDENREEYGATPPETVVKEVKRTHKEFPNKRLIIHFVQPHAPYIGEYGQKKFGQYPAEPLEKLSKRPEASKKTIRRAYRENLKYVLNYIPELLDILPGKTVITSDHGELLGEQLGIFPCELYGHFEGVYVEELVNVPWNIIESDNRKTITEDWPLEDEFGTDVRKQLEQLGYWHS